MSFFNFDDKKIKRAFYRIASLDNKSNKIDSEREENAIAEFLSGVKGKISKHDIALLQSQSLKFDDKDIKKEYRAIAKMNGNREIDTEEEYNLAKDFFEKNQENMSHCDILLWKNMMDVFQTENPKIVIKANVEDGAVLQIAIGDNLSNSVYVDETLDQSDDTVVSDEVSSSKPTEVSIENEKKDSKILVKTNELEKNIDALQEQVVEETSLTKGYTIKKGDYWYKMVEENYDVKSSAEIMKIVRVFKEEYFEKHKKELTKQGYSSPKAGFFLKVGEVYDLPLEVEVNGQIFKLK